jgi:hypothetical protein
LFTEPGTCLAVKATVVGLLTKYPEKCGRKIHKMSRTPFILIGSEILLWRHREGDFAVTTKMRNGLYPGLAVPSLVLEK